MAIDRSEELSCFAARPHSILYPVGLKPVPRSLMQLRGQKGGSKEDGTYLHIGIFQPWFSAATHPPWIGMLILAAIEAPVAVL